MERSNAEFRFVPCLTHRHSSQEQYGDYQSREDFFKLIFIAEDLLSYFTLFAETLLTAC
jgi:hypothetical protein